MSQENPKPASVLSELVAEARTLPVPELDWSKVDETLFARVERESAQRSALASHRGQPWPWLLLGGVAAAAAAALVMVQPSGHSSEVTAKATAKADSVALREGAAGQLSFQKGAGEVRIDGAKERAGAAPHGGDSIETRGATAVFEAPGRLSWLLEDESKVSVERTGGEGSPVVLALDHGAVEAQVTPVPSGEAFAVDVGGVRIAVHGTHLRVARDGDRVIVDLTEGVVSVGAPPKVGSTYGTLVTAPAHVELQVSSLATSLVIAHDTVTARKAVDVESVADEGTLAAVTPASAPAPLFVEAPAVKDTPKPIATRAKGSSSSSIARNPKAADDLIKSAIRACAGKPQVTALAHPTSDLSMTQTATVSFEVGADGFVVPGSNVTFRNPMPELTECANKAVRAQRFIGAGPHSIDIVDLPR
jgi:hypothetical protein